MKIEIELSKEQLNLIIKSLEINFRLMMGQANIVADELAEIPVRKEGATDEQWGKEFAMYLERRNDAECVINALSNILYDRMSLPDDSRRMSDMWSALRHAQYLTEHHENNDLRDVRSYEPMQLSDWEMIEVKILEE